MKLNLPILIAVAVVLAGLGALVLWQPDPSTLDLLSSSVEHARQSVREQGRKKNRVYVEGRDFIIDTPIILSRTHDEMLVRVDIRFDQAEPGREYHRVLRNEKAWVVDLDLGAHFRDFVEREKKALCDRLAKRLQERYQAAVDIPAENVRIAHRLREAPATGTPDVRLLGSVEIWFRDGGGEGRYIEDFTFAKGAWTPEPGGGSLFDRGPRPR